MTYLKEKDIVTIMTKFHIFLDSNLDHILDRSFALVRQTGSFYLIVNNSDLPIDKITQTKGPFNCPVKALCSINDRFYSCTKRIKTESYLKDLIFTGDNDFNILFTGCENHSHKVQFLMFNPLIKDTKVTEHERSIEVLLQSLVDGLEKIKEPQTMKAGNWMTVFLDESKFKEATFNRTFDNLDEFNTEKLKMLKRRVSKIIKKRKKIK